MFLENKNTIISNIKSQGHRITKARLFIIDIFLHYKKPLTVQEINLFLENKNIRVNKTTIYRELYFLRDINTVEEIDFGDNKKRYEIKTTHHHHLICIKCNKVEDVLFEQDMEKEQKRIAKQKKFKIINHSLKFFGLCEKCG